MGSEVSQHVHVHVDKPEHEVSLDKVKILTVDNRKFERRVKDAVYIKLMEFSLNKDGGCYLLPAVWTNLLRARVQVFLDRLTPKMKRPPTEKIFCRN